MLARSTKKMDPTLDTDLNVDNLGNPFKCDFSALTRLSVISADGGPLNSYRPLLGIRLDHSTNDHQLSASLSRLSCLLLYDYSLMRKLSSNHAWAYAGWWERAEDNSYLEGIEIILRETVRKSYPEDVDNPTVVSHYYERSSDSTSLGASERRPLDLAQRSILGTFLLLWLFVSCLMKDYRERSVANLEASNEEAKKQKDSEKQKRSDLIYTRRIRHWQSHFSWQWGPLRRLSPARESAATKILSVCDGRLHFTISATWLDDATFVIPFSLLVWQVRHFV